MVFMFIQAPPLSTTTVSGGMVHLQPIIITSALLEQTTSLPIPNLSEQATFTLEPPPPV